MAYWNVSVSLRWGPSSLLIGCLCALVVDRGWRKELKILLGNDQVLHLRQILMDNHLAIGGGRSLKNLLPLLLGKDLLLLHLRLHLDLKLLLVSGVQSPILTGFVRTLRRIGMVLRMVA